MRGFRDLVPFGRRDLFDLDEFFNLPAVGTFFPFENRGMRVDVRDAGENLVVEAELPGFSKEEIDISLHDNYLTITAEKKGEVEQEQEGFLRKERVFSKQQRTFALPSQVDEENVQAAYEAGVLSISLPKTEKRLGRKIDIQ